MQAFGPYPERVVMDFRDAVEVGLFGIYGQTGSGKSTIFSAMTFALFGAPAKPDQEAPSLRSDHADSGTLTEVEFVFEIGTRRFVILRRPEQMRLKQKGDGATRNPHEAFLFDATGLALDEINESQRGKIVAEKKVGVVDAAVTEMLGYGADQFRQIVLLPQGRFETFLSAKTKDRLEILRELFDVSLYRLLTSKLRADAEAVERHVRDEREVCARRLAAEDFESTDALTAGIVDAETRHADLRDSEQAALGIFEAAQSVVREGEKIDAQFKAAEEAASTRAALEADKGEMEALAARVVRAERARSLLDAEANVTDAADEVRKSEDTLRRAREAAADAEAKAKSATEALKKEADRAGEIEDLRRRIEELGRHEQALAKSAGIADELEKAQAAERGAAGKLDGARRGLTDLQNKRHQKSEALKAARISETRRQDLAARLAALKSSLAAAQTFEKASNDILAAKTDFEKLGSEHQAATRRAEETRATFDDIERRLSAAQALHLAAKLESGAPCPVCGSTEHPAPATRATEHVESDQAFLEARTAFQQADQAERELAQKLTGAQRVLEDRQARLTGLDRPDDSTAVLNAKVLDEQRALDDLGPQTDIVKAEAEIDRLSNEIETLDKLRDTLQDAYSACQSKTSGERVRLEEMLAAVPEHLRKQDALAAARMKDSQTLADRQKAKATAERTATETREAALTAQKDQQAANDALTICNERHSKAGDAFRSRLEQTGLSDDDFRAVKPAIATIDEDRATVEQHHRKLEIAKETAKKTAAAIQEQIRPDLEGIMAQQRDAGEKLAVATEQRSGAGHRLQQLIKLRNELAETLRKLDEAEAASGPLRNLAALVNGDNAQKLDLETFAIGAMFDRVLEAANLRIAPMTNNRYRLERDLEGAGRGRRGLGIQAFDVFTGKARPTATLSGGETFIAALALALGLADVVESASGKIRLDTIFIDEGFGSLDTENGTGTLDQVLQVLNKLVSQNRAVGIISHVPLVQEAVPNGFYVRKEITGSKVEARGAL
jgi:exonuclease SbcC